MQKKHRGKDRRRLARLERQIAGLTARLEAMGPPPPPPPPVPPPPGPTIETVRGVKIIVPPNDFNQAIVWSGDYEPHVMGRFLASVGPNDTFLDVGANIGFYSLMACMAGVKSVIAVEMSTENCKLIAASCRLNGFEQRVTILPMAATREVGMVSYPASDISLKEIGANTGITLENRHGFDVAISAPLDLVVGERPITIMKMDIEGFEYPALQGAKRLLDRFPLVFLEYCPWAGLRIHGVRGEELLSVFFQRGYSATVLAWDRTEEFLGQDQAAIDERFAEIARRNITHIDLMLTPPGRSA